MNYYGQVDFDIFDIINFHYFTLKIIDDAKLSSLRYMKF